MKLTLQNVPRSVQGAQLGLSGLTLGYALGSSFLQSMAAWESQQHLYCTPLVPVSPSWACTVTMLSLVERLISPAGVGQSVGTQAELGYHQDMGGGLLGLLLGGRKEG